MNYRLEDKLNIRSSNINLLRFICAIAVIICHSYAITLGKDDFISEYTSGQCNLGGIAVAVFFFLSGLYVAKSLEKTESIIAFIKKRCIRIFPQLWIVVVSSIILGLFLTTNILKYLGNPQTYMYLLNAILIPIHNLPGVFEYLPYSTVNGPLWTLPVEFVCYLGLAFIAYINYKWVKVKHSTRIIKIIGIVILFIAFVLLQIKMPDSMLFSAIRPMLVFYEGALYYEYRKIIKLNAIIAIILLIILALLGRTPFFNIGLVLLFPYIIIGISLGLPQIKSNSKLFMISYEMYLVGWPIQQIVMLNTRNMSPFENCIYALPIDICIGWLLYLLTDVTIKKLRR